MAASVWTGYLTFGLISMPVRLFSGARSSGISFNMLHRTDKSRLKQQYVCLADGEVVDRSDIVKGYEYRKDEYVIIEPEEIKKIEPKTAKTMEILEFEDLHGLRRLWLDLLDLFGLNDDVLVLAVLVTLDDVTAVDHFAIRQADIL